MIDSHINICKSLSLNALCGIYYKNCPLTGSQRTGNLVIKVNMSRSIYQVKDVLLTILRLINDTNSLRLNGYASLSLYVHIIENLSLHLTLGEGAGHFNNTVSQCRLTMIYMCNDAKISYFTLI